MKFFLISNPYNIVSTHKGKVYLNPTFRVSCTVRPLFKKFTQHCETYESTNCCVKKLHN